MSGELTRPTPEQWKERLDAEAKRLSELLGKDVLLEMKVLDKRSPFVEWEQTGFSWRQDDGPDDG